MDPDILAQHSLLWEQFSLAMLELAGLWAVCSVVLLFYRSFATPLALCILTGGMVLLVVAPISPASWGVLITAFVVFAYGRLARLYHPCLMRGAQREHGRG